MLYTSHSLKLRKKTHPLLFNGILTIFCTGKFQWEKGENIPVPSLPQYVEEIMAHQKLFKF